MAGTERRLERTIEDIQRFEAILKLLEQNPDELSHLHIPLVEDRLQHARKTLECVEQGKPFLATWYSNAPEICAAMDLHWYTQVAGAFVAAIESPHAMEDLEGVDQLSVPADCCTLLRMGLYYVHAGILPIPTAIVALVEPCDGVASLHEVIRNHKDWRNVPMFAPDPPYSRDERSIDYFAGELREMVVFLEEHTGRKLEMERLQPLAWPRTTSVAIPGAPPGSGTWSPTPRSGFRRSGPRWLTRRSGCSGTTSTRYGSPS